MKKYILCILFFACNINLECTAQGRNHNWLLGWKTGIDSFTTSKRVVLGFTGSSVVVNPDSFPMAFYGNQANISDEQGNLLLSTNGCRIANKYGNIVQNGDSLNPGLYADSWCYPIQYGGIPITNNSVFLPFADDSSKFVLFHLTGSDTNVFVSNKLYYSIVDISLNAGSGLVTQKNVVALQTALCPSIGACKHANGRDWWVVVMSSNSDAMYVLLFSPNGITQMPVQYSGLPPSNDFNGTVQFSPDGNKFAYYRPFVSGPTDNILRLRLLDFDRCTGIFTNPKFIDLIQPQTAGGGGFTLAFSPNSKYIYYGPFTHTFQVNTDTTDLLASLDTVGIQDSYCYPYTTSCTDFWYKYLAANGKIYISSGTTVVDMHYINEPDSEGVACDFRLHALRLPCYAFRNYVYHPNYYLGPVLGSVCDSLPHVGLPELSKVSKVSIQPNPSYNGDLRVNYMLPQNKPGRLIVHDMIGNEIYHMTLPPWSTMQDLTLSELPSGVYTITIISENSQETKRVVVIK